MPVCSLQGQTSMAPRTACCRRCTCEFLDKLQISLRRMPLIDRALGVDQEHSSHAGLIADQDVGGLGDLDMQPVTLSHINALL